MEEGVPKLLGLKEGVASVRRLLRKGVSVGGLQGGAKALFLSLLAEEVPLLLVVLPDQDGAEALFEDLLFFTPGGMEDTVVLFPADPPSLIPSPGALSQRMKALRGILEGRVRVVVTDLEGLCWRVPSPERLRDTRRVKVGEEVEREGFLRELQAMGYERVRLVEERGEMSVRGGILDLFPPDQELPVRLEFFGDTVESIRSFDPTTQRSTEELQEVLLLPFTEGGEGKLLDYLEADAPVFLLDRISIEERAEELKARGGKLWPPDHLIRMLDNRPLVEMDGDPSSDFLIRCERLYGIREEVKGKGFRGIASRVREWMEEGWSVYFVVHSERQAERVRELFGQYGVVFSIAHYRKRRLSPEGRAWLVVGELSGGFLLPEEGLVFISEEEVFGEKGRVAKAPRPSAPPLSSFEDLEVGDYLVHVDYGIGLYRGLSRLEFEGEKKEFLLIEYEGGDRLYVPIERLDLVHKYFGPREEPPRLDRLGSASWRRAKRRAKRAAEEIARELIEIYAARKAFEGFAFSPRDAYYQEFEATFPYEETPDQWQAIEDVMRDMESPRPMDRLICGDVGFGKTEVAIRAAFKAVMDGKQVALLVPTTVLAQQHYQTFSARFQGYPIVVEMLSRFRSPRRQREILEGLREGKVDVVIGTHRLLQKDVRFRDLGLLIIDEEQRFGVAHKERLKELKKTVDCLTLTATPIPRTLQMSLVGIREMSLISTPPPARQTISTRVLPFDPRTVREAIIKEVRRGGQVFFVHNRVKEIQEVARRLQELVPEVRIGIAHGQMRERELERVMLRFVRGEIDLLVCTSIIESGLDIPNANTIIINRADRFGLADLYQLRGRVGRSAKKAYAYLLVPPRKELTASSAKRLRAIQELSELGSGFRLALRDLEIRGAGNLLGHRQSGHIAEVGLELYNALLEEAIRELKGEEVPKKVTPEIHIPIEAYIPEEYVEEETQRLGLYKRLSLVEGEEELEELKEEIRDRFGPPPAEVRNLFEVIELKIWLQRYRVQRLEIKAGELRLLLSDGRVDPERLVRAVEESKGKARLTPSGELILEVGGMGWRKSIEEAKTFLQRLS